MCFCTEDYPLSFAPGRELKLCGHHIREALQTYREAWSAERFRGLEINPTTEKKIVESFVIFIELRPHHALASAQIWAILSKFAGDQRDDTSLDDWWEGNARSWSFLHVVPDYACFKGASSFKHLKTQKLWIILNLYFAVLLWLSACVQSWFHHFDLFSPCQQCVVVGGLGIWLSNGRPGLQI